MSVLQRSHKNHAPFRRIPPRAGQLTTTSGFRVLVGIITILRADVFLVGAFKTAR